MYTLQAGKQHGIAAPIPVDLTNGGEGAVDGTLTTEQAKGNRGLGVIQPTVAAKGGNRTSGEIDVSTAVNAHGGSHGRMDFESETFVVASPITASAGHHGWSGGHGDGSGNIVAAPLTAGSNPNSNAPGRHREDDENLVPVEVQAFNWQAGGGQEQSFKGKSRQYPVRAGDYTGALSATRHDALAIRTAHQGANGEGLADDEANTIDGGPVQAVAYGISSDAIDRSGEGSGGTSAERAGLGIVEDASPTVRSRHPNAVAFHLTQDPINGPESPAIGAGNENGCSTIGVATFHEAQITSKANRTRVEPGRDADTLNGDPRISLITPMTVRRLTPRECERLQGFPDDWTRWRADGSEISDGARYRLVGNAVAVPVIRWIGRRLRAVMEQEQ